MSSRRTLILIAAIVVGIVAAVALFQYIGGIEDRANDNAERVEVFRAAGPIIEGTFGSETREQELVVPGEIPREFRPDNAITSFDQIEGLVAASAIAANQVIVQGMFVDPAVQRRTFQERIPDGDVAITISVDQVRGVAGLLVPGDEVNILVTVASGAPTDADVQDAAAANPEAGELLFAANQARYLYQKVQILAVGQSPVRQPGETSEASEPGTQTSGLITFNVPPDAAQLLASVDAGDFYLTLVPEDYQPVPLGALPPAPLLPGEDPTLLTPYGPEGKP